MKGDWENVALIVGVILLFILFYGEPDLMSAIIHALMK